MPNNDFYNQRKRNKTKKGNKAYYAVMAFIVIACTAVGVYSWMSFKNIGNSDSGEFMLSQEVRDTQSTQPEASDGGYASEVENLLNDPLEHGDLSEVELETQPATPTSDSSIRLKGQAEVKASEQPVAEAEVVFPEFIAPVSGKVCMEYSMEAPVFCETLQEWRTHSGIDIAAELGSAVKCAADGVVQFVKNDPRYGTTVIVDHLSGVKTVYSNLAEKVEVAAGKVLSSGDTLGYVGTTAYFESDDVPHLHLEVLENNEPVDPTDMIPKK